MDYISHSIGGTLASVSIVVVSSKLGIECNDFILVGGAIVGSLLPDIDHPKSYLGKRVAFLSNTLYSSVGHRTLTHSLLFSCIVGVLCALFSVEFGIGMTIGILSHIALDMLSPNGVAFLYPWKKNRIKLFR